MDWVKTLFQHRNDRHELIQLTYQLEYLSRQFVEKTAGLKAKSSEYQDMLSLFAHESEVVAARIGQIETDRTLRRAYRWRIPMPHRPYAEGEDSDFWQWNAFHGRYYLTDQAMSIIRKEAYQEWEMATKPWLSWGAIAISTAALIVAALKP